jgi:hypothetical protein
MTWGAVGGAAISVIGGSLMGGSKAPERAAKDAAAKAQYAQDQARLQSMEALDPYLDTGRGASRKLAQLLGVADPEGYAPRPDFASELTALQSIWNKSGKINRNTNVAALQTEAKKRYDQKLAAWEAGKKEYQSANPGSGGSGDLLKEFTNDDFEKDPGYEFRQAEGEKGINRSLAARGGFNSGAALKALDRYNQDYASNEFSNAYNRDAANKARTFSFLSGSAGQGLQAAGTISGANTNAANQNSQIQSNLGSNLANMYTQDADNQSNMFQSAVGNALYAYERNKPVTGSADQTGGYSTPPFNGSSSQKPWYLS